MPLSKIGKPGSAGGVGAAVQGWNLSVVEPAGRVAWRGVGQQGAGRWGVGSHEGEGTNAGGGAALGGGPVPGSRVQRGRGRAENFRCVGEGVRLSPGRPRRHTNRGRQTDGVGTYKSRAGRSVVCLEASRRGRHHCLVIGSHVARRPVPRQSSHLQAPCEHGEGEERQAGWEGSDRMLGSAGRCSVWPRPTAAASRASAPCRGRRGRACSRPRCSRASRPRSSRLRSSGVVEEQRLGESAGRLKSGSSSTVGQAMQRSRRRLPVPWHHSHSWSPLPRQLWQLCTLSFCRVGRDAEREGRRRQVSRRARSSSGRRQALAPWERQPRRGLHGRPPSSSALPSACPAPASPRPAAPRPGRAAPGGRRA